MRFSLVVLHVQKPRPCQIEPPGLSTFKHLEKGYEGLHVRWARSAGPSCCRPERIDRSGTVTDSPNA